MPMNKYECSKCKRTYQYIGPYADRACPDCGTTNKPSLPRNITSPSSMETVDKARNVKHRQDQKERAIKRNENHQKIDAKETARIHGDSYEQHGVTEDDARFI